QNIDRQEKALSDLGLDKLFIEKKSGKTTNRPVLREMLNYIREDDVLYVEGRIITDSYEDASTGQRKWTTEVDARQVINYNEVFTDGISANSSVPSPPTNADTTSFTAPSPTSVPTETLPIQPVDESDFFKAPSVNDTENELEEDVPF
ncbi:MAG: recombinase family protein, partial [Candidatus Marinamargulisbacteria bacterium]